MKNNGFSEEAATSELEVILRREERRCGFGSNLIEVPFLLVTPDGPSRNAKALEIILHSEFESGEQASRWQFQINVGSSFARITNEVVERLFFLARELAHSSHETASNFEKLLFKDSKSAGEVAL